MDRCRACKGEAWGFEPAATFPECDTVTLEASEDPFRSRSGGVRKLLDVDVVDDDGLGWL